MTLREDKYMSIAEVAAYLHINPKSARTYFIHGRRVEYIQLDRKFLILRDSFLRWEEEHVKRTCRRGR